MIIDDKIRGEKLQYDINREEQQKHQYYHLEKLINVNIWQVKEYCLKSKTNNRKAKFAYSPLGKAYEEHTEKQVAALKPLDLSNRKYELKQIQSIFLQNLMNDLIRVKLKEIVNLQDFIKKDDLNYQSKGKFLLLN